MTPIDFIGRNVIYGEGQPDYQPLPALRMPNGDVYHCWQFTNEELERMSVNRKFFIKQATGNMPLQPILAIAELGDDLYIDGYNISDVIAVTRAVFCNPHDEHWIKQNCLSDDIKVFTTESLPINGYYHTPDVIADLKIHTGATNEDFINNEMTIICSHTFR